MDSVLSEIKNRFPLVDYVGSKISLKKSGSTYKANCPFHKEKSPSFVVSGNRNIWRCFGACQKGGDLITFVMEWEKCSFLEAVKLLCKEANITLDGILNDETSQKKDRLFEMNRLASQYYNYLLQNHKSGEIAREYLKTRKISDAVVKTFVLGYAPTGWNNLQNFLEKKGYKKSELVEAGLLVENDKGDIYDRFRERIIFPIFDTHGGVVALAGRILQKSDNLSAKYVNSPETPLYQKRATLYGLYQTQKSILEKEEVIVVEGEFDMLTCFSVGLSNVVAIKGSAFTKEQLQILGRYTKRIILALDSDFAGNEASMRAINDALGEDFDVRVVEMTQGKDPDEAIKLNKSVFIKDIEKSVAVYDYIIEYNSKKFVKNADIMEIKRAVDAVLPFIAKIPNPILQTHYLNKLATKFDLKNDDLEKMLKKVRLARYSKFGQMLKPNELKVAKDRLQILTEELLIMILAANDPSEFAIKAMNYLGAELESIDSVISTIITIISNQNNFEIEGVLNALPPQILPRFDDAYLQVDKYPQNQITLPILETLLDELIQIIIKNRLKNSLNDSSLSNSNQNVSKDTQTLIALEKKRSMR